jgi:hypothetical protein
MVGSDQQTYVSVAKCFIRAHFPEITRQEMKMTTNFTRFDDIRGEH